MKRVQGCWKSAVLMLWLGCLLLGAVAGHAEPVRFVYFYKFEPFSWTEDEQKIPVQGVFIDVVNEAFRRLGISVTHAGYPWKRAQSMVQNGAADGMCTIITPERLTYAQGTTTPIVVAHFKIFTAAIHPKLEQLKQMKTIQELADLKFVDIRGSGWAERYLKGMDVHFIDTYQQLFLYLNAGRADVAIRNDWQTRYQIKKLGFTERILMLPQSMTSDPQAYSILIGKTSPFVAHIERLNAVLREMDLDGILQIIYSHYQ